MLRIALQMAPIPYGALVDQALPAALKRLAPSGDASGLLRLLARHGRAAGSALSAALSLLPQRVKDELAARALAQHSGRIAHAANRFCQAQGIPLSIASLHARQMDGLMVSLRLAPVDYPRLAMALLDRLKRAGAEPPGIGALLARLGRAPENMLLGALEALTQAQRDEVIRVLAAYFQPQIIEAAHGLLRQAGIELTIRRVIVYREGLLQ